MRILAYIGMFMLGQLCIRIIIRVIQYFRRERVIERWDNATAIFCISLGDNDIEIYDFSRWESENSVYIQVILGEEKQRYLPKETLSILKENKDGVMSIAPEINIIKTNKRRFFIEHDQT